jgi:hypothetical protein
VLLLPADIPYDQRRKQLIRALQALGLIYSAEPVGLQDSDVLISSLWVQMCLILEDCPCSGDHSLQLDPLSLVCCFL